jgi:hypothetical protein
MRAWENPAVPPALRYVDPERPRGLLSRSFARFSATRLGRLISTNVVWRLDPYLLRATRGRVGMGLMLPTALLETRGAKSGAVRRNAVIAVAISDDGDTATVHVGPNVTGLSSGTGADWVFERVGEHWQAEQRLTNPVTEQKRGWNARRSSKTACA